MPITITRSDFEKLDHPERHRRIAEGCVVVDDDWKEQEARREPVAAELAQWRADHARPKMKLSDFKAMSDAQRNEYIKSGGIVVD